MKETDPSQIKEKPEYGGYVYGLFIEAAAWDHNNGHLTESEPKVLFNRMPMIWFMPAQIGEKDPSRHVSL